MKMICSEQSVYIALARTFFKMHMQMCVNSYRSARGHDGLAVSTEQGHNDHEVANSNVLFRSGHMQAHRNIVCLVSTQELL
jgi:hypothetical protein